MRLKVRNAKLRYELYAARLRFAAMRVMAAVIERRYRADQPRVPAGRPDGGQWTRVGGGSIPVRVGGRVVFGGYLARQNYDSIRNVTECMYRDTRYNYTFVRIWPGRVDCTTHALY